MISDVGVLITGAVEDASEVDQQNAVGRMMLLMHHRMTVAVIVTDSDSSDDDSG